MLVVGRHFTQNTEYKMNPIAEQMPGFQIPEDWTTDEATTGAVPFGNSSRDERKSPRYGVPEARQSCELKIGAKILPASLVNESEDGFSVLIDRLDGLKSGKKVELHTHKGWYQVRIIYINMAARPAGAAPECGSWYRLGMKIKKRLQKP
jgi:hypothetical protein